MSNRPLHLFLLLLVPLASCRDANYYWREYTGSIPEDAVEGGVNINGDQVYIGQAYVKYLGLIPAQINAGVKEVYVPIDGVQIADRHIKILCGPLGEFVWVPTNATNLHVELLNRQVVIGGYEDNSGTNLVGRISYEGGAQIGKINIGSTEENAPFRFVDVKIAEKKVSTYEVLVYQEWN